MGTSRCVYAIKLNWSEEKLTRYVYWPPLCVSKFWPSHKKCDAKLTLNWSCVSGNVQVTLNVRPAGCATSYSFKYLLRPVLQDTKCDGGPPNVCSFTMRYVYVQLSSCQFYMQVLASWTRINRGCTYIFMRCSQHSVGGNTPTAEDSTWLDLGWLAI